MNNKTLFVLSGSFEPNGGMFEYLKTWISQSETMGVSIAIVASPQVCSCFPGVKTFPLWTSSSKRVDYKKVFFSRLIYSKCIRNISECISTASREFSPDLIHFVDITLFVDYFVREILIHQPEVNVFLTLHDPKPHNEKISTIGKWFKKKLYRNLEALSIKYKKFFLHIHDKRLIEGADFSRSTKFVEIPHPIPQRIAQRNRPLWELTGNSRFRIGFMGRIEEYKGLNDLCEALEHLFSRVPSLTSLVEMVIIGRGDLDRIRWEGLPCTLKINNDFVDDLQFHQEMADLDILVLPYREGTQSGVAAMAVAYGIPIIASKVGALDQLVYDGDNGRLIKPCHPEELCSVMLNIIQSSECYGNLLQGAKSRKPL